MSLLQAQDQDPSFRQVAGSAKIPKGGLRPASNDRPSTAAPAPEGQRIVVFCEDNDGEETCCPISFFSYRSCLSHLTKFPSTIYPILAVTSVAMSVVAIMAQAGRDHVFLVTVVPTALQQEQGKRLVMRCAQQLQRVMVQVGRRRNGGA